jgi:two-component system cell cycle response regulator
MAKAKILVVEGERFYIEYYREVLEKEGFRVDVAHSTAEALRRVKAEAFDLIIADVVVKGNSGLDLLVDIKREDPTRDVIMVTSMQSLRKAVDALKLGASDYLTKPVDRDELLLAINRILERQVVSHEHTKLISENIHFYELLRIQKKNLALLSLLDLDKLKDAIPDVLVQELSAASATLYLREPGSRTFTWAASRGDFESGEEVLDLLLRADSIKTALEEGRPVLESAEGEQWVAKSTDEGYRLLMPVRFRHETVGAVRMSARRGGRPYGSLDIDLARHILEAAGMALRNTREVRRMEHLGITGESPGTFSPSYFRFFAETELSVARRYNRESAVVAISLDNLPFLRTRLKETQVQGVIDRFTESVLEIIRETDIMSRIEDDLFAVIVPETDYYGSLMLKKRIRSKLAHTTYPIDLKRDLAPDVHIGCAACPQDGGHLADLLEIARARLKEERESLLCRLKIEGKGLWGLVDILNDPGVPARIEAHYPALAPQLRPISLTMEGYEELARSFLRDLESFCNSRGLLYLGLGTATPDSPVFRETNPREDFRVSIYALGAKGSGIWSFPHITPVFINDPRLAERIFLLGMTEDTAYALFCRHDGQGALTGFHTSDENLVLELVGALQEQYLLQRRIG